jgi:glucan 1,3-beta-glucosidase
MYGTAFEHNALYQYSLVGARNVLMAMIQTETPYYQPSAAAPFSPSYPSDPVFCTGDALCNMSFALNVQDAADVYLYGAGHYSFFNVWSQDCLKGQPHCQRDLVRIRNSTQIYMHNLNTYGSQYMLTSAEPFSMAAAQSNTFCSTAAVDFDLF